MFTYKIIQPFAYSIDAGSLKDAIKNFVKMHYDINMTKIVLAEQDKLYEARLKRYMAESGSHKVGIDVYPYSGPYNNGLSPYAPSLFNSIGSMFNPMGSAVLSPVGSSMMSPLGLPSMLSPMSPVASMGIIQPTNVGTVINTSSQVEPLPKNLNIPIIPNIDATPFNPMGLFSPDGMTEAYNPPTIINIVPKN